LKLDSKFNEGDIECYLYEGKILEYIVNKIQYSNKSTAVQRRNTNFQAFCSEIDHKCKDKGIKYQKLKSKHIYDDWTKKYTRKDGKEYKAFKADVTDIVLRTDLINSNNMYNSFIEDLFWVYSLRSRTVHDNAGEIIVDEESIDKLIKTIKVLFQLI